MEQNERPAAAPRPALQQTAPELAISPSWQVPWPPQPDPMPPGLRPPYQPPAGQLPGAIRNPCCMGTEALDMIQVLTGFIEEELADRTCYQALQRKAPGWARQGLRELAEQSGEHAGRLLSACYLITGQCYRPVGTTGPVYIQGWCQALRERYHTAACGGLNYARAADGTGDPCLRELLLDLSRAEYRQAETLMARLQRSL